MPRRSLIKAKPLGSWHNNEWFVFGRVQVLACARCAAIGVEEADAKKASEVRVKDSNAKGALATRAEGPNYIRPTAATVVWQAP